MRTWWKGSGGKRKRKRHETGPESHPQRQKERGRGWEEDPRTGRTLKLRIAAPPVEGRANKAVILFLASWLGIPKTSVILLRGETGRLKVVELPEECAEKLSRLVL